MSLSSVAAGPASAPDPRSAYLCPSNPAAASQPRAANARFRVPTRAAESPLQNPMSDAFLLPLSNIQVARFFTKAPGPKSRFFRFFSKNSFWRLNCYLIHFLALLVLTVCRCRSAPFRLEIDAGQEATIWARTKLVDTALDLRQPLPAALAISPTPEHPILNRWRSCIHQG